jgi:fluoride exporter
VGRARAEHRRTVLSALLGRPQAAAIGVGGAAGAALRWAVLDIWPVVPGSMPWTVLLINVVGSAMLGVAMAEEWRHPRARLALHDAVGIGFCGGLTTFSTFAVEIAMLGRHGHTGTAAAYAVLSVATSVVAVVAGAAAFRRIAALDRPLEGEP